ncbi:MAG: tetratricopeptide repeat protein [Nitrospirae bacterium]|uniref:tetratricopeptide repeat protein n=1 Tax=Candidatus Magnetobacterium casense TaxID=1455061 RepID=UPI00138E4C8F|nr:tetratricopeptide repeat protein [Candidatus Magnetobacterium casensis]MBF0337024.1 tetratricopeptide repeat protein [Nitrospirota bacterium]
MYVFKPRGIANLTFFLNYKLHAFNVAGYHIFNLIIHLLNAVLIYLMVTGLFKAQNQLFQTPDNADTEVKNKLAFLIALLFVNHPLQMQAVTMTIQRYTSLVTMFCLLAIIVYLKWRFSIAAAENNSSPEENSNTNIRRINVKAISLYLLSFIFAVLAALTKQTSVTLPIIITIIEFMFFTGPRLKRLLPCIPFYLIIPLVTASSIAYLDDTPGVGVIQGQHTLILDRWQYLFTEFRVIITYIRMFFLPVNLTLIYHYPPSLSLWEHGSYIYFMVLCSIFAFGLYLCYRALKNRDIRRREIHFISFGILWFFVTIAPQSSIIPLSNWVILEYRVYMATVGFFIVIISALLKLINVIDSKRASIILTVLIVTISMLHGVITYKRNTLWHSAVTLFEDNVKKYPESIPAHTNLAVAYMDAGQYDNAMEQYQLLLNRLPHNTDILVIIGELHARRGNVVEAMKVFQSAQKINPLCTGVHLNMGNIYAGQGNFALALKEYRAELKISPSAGIYNNMGFCYEQLGNLTAAKWHYEMAIEHSPDFAEAHNNLGALYQSIGDKYEAIKEYKKALQIQPDYPEAMENLRSLQP